MALSKINDVPTALVPNQGIEADLTGVRSHKLQLLDGEFIYSTDTKKLFIVDGGDPYVREMLVEFPGKKRGIMHNMAT